MTFTATLNTSLGAVDVPNVSLFGHQSIILVTDYALGPDHTLLYSSADVATYGLFGDAVALVLYLKVGQTGQFAFKNEPGLTYTVYGDSTVVSSNSTVGPVITYTQSAGATFVQFSNGVLVYLLDQQTAWQFWAPSTTSDVYGSPDSKIFILGSYLVRSASVEDGVLQVLGDNNVTTTIEAYVGPTTALTSIQWNGLTLNATRTAYGTYKAALPGTESLTITLPALTNWQSADSLPEADPSFDDSNWTIANKTTTQAYIKPYTLPVLFSSDYGYYVGAKVYRGYFPGATNYTSVNITASGGAAFGWSAFLNGVSIGGDPGNTSALETTTAVLSLPASALSSSPSQPNVLTVLVDYHGHDEASTAGGLAVPRGLYGAQLLPATSTTSTGFTTWKIQGNAGGSANIDPVRGPLNEGGLYAERLGWHLPGFIPNASSSTWDNTSTPLTGLSAPGVRFYKTTFTLAIPSGLDVPLGIALSAPAGTVARVMLWVNGYQYGKFEPHIGPQTVFPLQPGVVNNNGTNTFALSLWAMEDGGAALDRVELVSYGVYHSGFAFNRDWSALQPGWVDRSAYA